MSFHRAGGGGGTASSRMSSEGSSSKSSKSRAHRRLVHLAHYMVHCAPACDHRLSGVSGQVQVQVDVDHLRASYSPVPPLLSFLSLIRVFDISLRATVFIISPADPYCRAKTSSNLLPPNLDPNLPCSPNLRCGLRDAHIHTHSHTYTTHTYKHPVVPLPFLPK